jgi:ATP-dependent Lon protease
MKSLARLVLLSILMSFTQTGGFFAQERGSGPPVKSLREEIKSNKRIRQERREKRKLEKAEQKAIKKHHKRIQTKKVRKRMKASRKTSRRINNNEREFFLTRWLRKL